MTETDFSSLKWSKDAVRALLYEVSVTPKPGLVDPSSQGPHPDMDVFTFIDSAMSLQGYFKEAAILGGQQSISLLDLFQQLRRVGQQAETTMSTATNGVNTHKGAVFSLGILVAASAYQQANGGDLQEIIRTMLEGLTANDFANVDSKAADDLTAGEIQYLKMGYTGIRGEAEAGYPTVFDYGLPALRKATGSRNQRLLDTLLTIAAHNTDSNLLKRAGNDPAIVDWAHNQANEILALGGSQTPAGMAKLEAMNQVFLEKNLSLGGSADLLVLTIFLGFQEGLLTFE